MYRTGFARFSHQRFTTEDLTNTFIHCTNVAVQKGDTKYDDGTMSKWELRSLKLFLASKYGAARVEKSFAAIQEIFIHSLKAVQSLLVHDKHCFELFGYDIMLDSNLKPWLLEVNAYPSFSASTKEDDELKVAMLDDALSIIDMERLLTGTETQVGGFDLIFKDGPVLIDHNSTSFTLLGCINNRVPQLKILARSSSARLSIPEKQLKEQPSATLSKSAVSDTRSAKMNDPSPTNISKPLPQQIGVRTSVPSFEIRKTLTQKK